MFLTFTLFGPLEAHRDGLALAVPGGRQRALLVLLLLAQGETLSPARLIAELWPGAVPPSAAANLRSHLSGVRSWLVRAGEAGPRLVRRPSGWRLDAPGPRSDSLAVELDVTRFEADLRDGRRAARDGDHRVAVTRLANAVAARRGAPLQDVPQGPVLSDRARVLAYQWLVAVEEYAESLLSLGRAEEVRHLLFGFLSQHPYRERGWALLMLACYRDGDPAGALHGYQQARSALVSGLGLEPGPELAALHRAILRRDPVLSRPGINAALLVADLRDQRDSKANS